MVNPGPTAGGDRHKTVENQEHQCDVCRCSGATHFRVTSDKQKGWLVACLPQLLVLSSSRPWISLWRNAKVKPTTTQKTEQALVQASDLPFQVQPRPVMLLHTDTGAIAPTKSPPAPISHQNLTGTPKRS